MLTIDDEQLLHLSRRPGVLGALLVHLADSPSATDAGGWRVVPTDPESSARMGRAETVSRTDPTSSVVLTSAEDGPIRMHAHGRDWAIELPRGGAPWRRVDDGIEDEELRHHDEYDPVFEGSGMHQPPAYTAPDFDWNAQIAATPHLTICRIHMLARSMNMEWNPHSTAPAGDMVRALYLAQAAMNAGEAIPEDCTLGVAVAHLELMRFGEKRDRATDGMVEHLMDELGFGGQDDDRNRSLDVSGGSRRMRVHKDADGWNVDVSVLVDGLVQATHAHAHGLSPAAALRRIHALSRRPADSVDVTSPSDSMLRALAKASGCDVVMDGTRISRPRTAVAVLRSLGVGIDPAASPDDLPAAALKAAYGADLDIVAHPF